LPLNDSAGRDKAENVQSYQEKRFIFFERFLTVAVPNLHLPVSMVSLPARILLALSAFFGLTAVLTGALGAHALEEKLASRDMVAVWETAVLYHLAHSLALLALSIWVNLSPGATLRIVAGAAWTVGILLFSGSLYFLALGGPRILGPITPIGGLFLMAGWTALFLMAFARRQKS
jgi:uncharacterized membrane protein YgdD (TMEM256/DUF423 family)